MSNAIYNPLKKKLLEAGVDFVDDTLKVMLVNNSYAPDIDTDEFIDDVSANEISGTGYTAGGKALTGKAVTQDSVNDLAKFDANDVTWATSTLSAVRGAVLYKDTGTPATSPVICYLDFGADKYSSNADFTIQFDSDGILSLA